MPKTDPKKDTSPAVEAAADATTPPDETLTVDWRGETFDFPVTALADPKFLLLMAGDNSNLPAAFRALLTDEQTTRFLAKCERGDNFFVLFGEFIDQLSELAQAAGQGNR